jgi:hypothetical protein
MTNNGPSVDQNWRPTRPTSAELTYRFQAIRLLKHDQDLWDDAELDETGSRSELSGPAAIVERDSEVEAPDLSGDDELDWLLETSAAIPEIS